MPFDPRQHLIQLKGKDYLPVAARLVWLSEDAPRYTIQTAILKLEEGYAVVQATVTISSHEGTALKNATALKREDKAHFPDFLEKAETGAIGRALGMLGYGTQFAPEFDELQGNLEPRVVDSPIAASAQRTAQPQPDATLSSALETPPFEPGLIDTGEPSAQIATDYDHAAVDAGELFSEPKQRRVMAIATALFDLSNSALTARVLEASSKILKRRVSQLSKLHWRDGNKIMRQLEGSAVKRGVWSADASTQAARAKANQTN